MTSKKMVEYSISVPADSRAAVSVVHTPGGEMASIETETGRYDVARREYEVDE